MGKNARREPGRTTRREYLNAIRHRYLKADKATKKAMLDKFCSASPGPKGPLPGEGSIRKEAYPHQDQSICPFLFTPVSSSGLVPVGAQRALGQEYLLLSSSLMFRALP